MEAVALEHLIQVFEAVGPAAIVGGSDVGVVVAIVIIPRTGQRVRAGSVRGIARDRRQPDAFEAPIGRQRIDAEIV